MKRIGLFLLAVVFMLGGMQGCASVPSSVETLAMQSSARIVGCYAVKEVKAEELNTIIELTKVVASSADSWEITGLINKIKLLDDEDLNKLVALSLRDLLAAYGIGLDALTSNDLMPIQVKIMAEAFLEGVEICSVE